MSVEDPRLTVWARDQAAHVDQNRVERRVRIIERTIGVAAKIVRDDINASLAVTNANVDAATATADNAGHALATQALLTRAGLEGKAVDFGIETVTFTGSTSNAFEVVNHQLGRFPGAVFLTPFSQSGSGPVSAQVFDYGDDTAFAIYLTTVPVGSDPGYQPPAGTAVPVSWLIIG